MEELEQRLSEYLHELIQKREDLKALQIIYDSKLLRERELEVELASLRSELGNLHTQLEYTKRMLHKCDEGLRTTRENAVKCQMNLEISTNNGDAMKELMNKLHLENSKLKHQVEELERSLKSESFFRTSYSAKEEKTAASVNTLTLQIHNLEKDFQNMERQISEALSFGAKSTLLLKHKDAKMVQQAAQIDQLSAKLSNVMAENKCLHDNMKNGTKPTEQPHYIDEILQEWQTSQKEWQRRSTSWTKESETLHNTLQKALEAQSRFQKLEEGANQRVKNLEEKLKAAKEEKTNNTDCSVQTDLNITIDIACQTVAEEIQNIPPAQSGAEKPESKQDSSETIDQQQSESSDPSDSTETNLKNKLESGKNFVEPNTNNPAKPVDSDMLSRHSLRELWALIQKNSESPLSQDLCDVLTQPNTKINK